MKNQGKVIRRMGYVRDQEGIMNRYLRESSHWDLHLKKTRKFIQDSFQDPRIQSVAVLGSGWLLDVPLEALSKRFKQVYLVDIRHPVQIRKKTSGMPNVELLESDLSGGAIEQLWQLTQHKGGVLDKLDEQIQLTPPLFHIHPDALISVNLLNQLDIILCDFMAKQPYFQQDSAKQLRSLLQDFHLQWITDSPGCLISDVREIREDKKGHTSSKSLLHTQLPKGIRQDQWTWEFDSTGSYHPETLTRMEVRALEWA